MEELKHIEQKTRAFGLRLKDEKTIKASTPHSWMAELNGIALEAIRAAKPGARGTLPTSREANQIVDGLLAAQYRKEKEGVGDTVEGARGAFNAEHALGHLADLESCLFDYKSAVTRATENKCKRIVEILREDLQKLRPSTPLTGTQEAES